MITPFTLLVEKLAPAKGKEAVMLLTFDGELDETNIEIYAPRIYEIIEKGSDRLTLIFRLQGLSYMNSKAIGYLTDWSNKIKAENGRIIITDVQAHIKDLLKTIGLDDLFKEYGTLEEAKKEIY